jgi:hypothetical protein
MVNERAILSPLASLSTNPDVDISINLPKLHPEWETPDRHFTANSVPLPIDILRRYRQRYHGVQRKDSSFRVQHKPDFPVLNEFPDFVGMDMTMKELEETERGIREGGDDPMQELRDLDPCRNFCGVV